MATCRDVRRSEREVDKREMSDTLPCPIFLLSWSLQPRLDGSESPERRNYSRALMFRVISRDTTHTRSYTTISNELTLANSNYPAMNMNTGE